MSSIQSLFAFLLVLLFTVAECKRLRGRNRRIDQSNPQTSPAPNNHEIASGFAIDEPIDSALTEAANSSRQPPSVYYSSHMEHILEQHSERTGGKSQHIYFGTEVMLASTIENKIINRHFGNVQGVCSFQDEVTTRLQCELTFTLDSDEDDEILASGDPLVNNDDVREEGQVLEIVGGTGRYEGVAGVVRLTFLGRPFEGIHDMVQVDFEVDDSTSLTTS